MIFGVVLAAAAVAAVVEDLEDASAKAVTPQDGEAFHNVVRSEGGGDGDESRDSCKIDRWLNAGIGRGHAMRAHDVEVMITHRRGRLNGQEEFVGGPPPVQEARQFQGWGYLSLGPRIELHVFIHLL